MSAKAAPAAVPMEWFCDMCGFTIDAGEPRFDCVECGDADWCCCGPCHDQGAAFPPEALHPHPLTPNATHISTRLKATAP